MADEIGAHIYSCDATDPDAVSGLFNAFHADIVSLDILAYNLSVVPCGPVTEVDPVWIKNAIIVSAYGAFLAAQHAEIRMLGAGSGRMFFTGARAPPGMKGYPQSAPFAMGEFALRGLCQSLARELAPQNIHVAYFVIDGHILNMQGDTTHSDLTTTLNPDDIAQSYLHIVSQNRSAWT